MCNVNPTLAQSFEMHRYKKFKKIVKIQKIYTKMIFLHTFDTFKPGTAVTTQRFYILDLWHHFFLTHFSFSISNLATFSQLRCYFGINVEIWRYKKFKKIVKKQTIYTKTILLPTFNACGAASLHAPRASVNQP